MTQRQHIDGTMLFAVNRRLWDDVRERVTSEDTADAERDRQTDEWLAAHNPAEAVAEWFGWNFGDDNWGPTLMSHLRSLLACDAQYQLRADHDTEQLLEELLGGPIDA